MNSACPATISATEFEKLVAQIIRLLGEGGASVEHNAKVVDQDTASWRQIDILVQRQGQELHYECRHHSSPQDVKWIEELIGRKISLRADGMVAVSSSGFTVPAIAKAKMHSIGLLDFRAISHEALSTFPTVFCEWLEFSNMKVHIGSHLPISSHHAFRWVSKLGLSSYEHLERLVHGLRGRVAGGNSLPFWQAMNAIPQRYYESSNRLVSPARLHLSGVVHCYEKTYSIQNALEMNDLIVSNWLANIYTFGVDGCYYIKSIDVERLFIDLMIFKLPKGSALTKIAFFDSGRDKVALSGNISEMRKPPSMFSVEVSHEDKRETLVHRAFQKASVGYAFCEQPAK
ncbi:restriction endonuclease [Pseudorhodobacter sp. W20_MBD10_FR17]|uniref:restriction endonuclease n=1 Tax=Pseudorhodobacter sp. W20_MBD10_FR17 TaxID=3240266 RepID=UPI003F99AF4B